MVPEPILIPKAPYTAPEQELEGISAKEFIYFKESRNDPYAVNKNSGACGLGQALPCSKMPCSLGDYDCQDAFFTNYMKSRYGTWENAKAFWLAQQAKGGYGWW